MAGFFVLVPDRLPPPADVEAAVFGTAGDVVVVGASAVHEVPEPMWARADAVLAWHDLQFDAALLAKLTRCRVLVRVGVGFDNVDLQAAGERGICVCNVPDYGTNDVADHALGLFLTLARGLVAFNDSLRRSLGEWSWRAAGSLKRVTGARMGIVGLGRIGTAVALRAKAFGMHVAFYDPYREDGIDKALGITRARHLDELVATAEVVTLHAPLTPETRGMIDEAFLARLATGALLINTARGGLLDLDALHTALRSGHLRGAGLDVLPTEPPPEGHPLIRAWRERAPWIEGRLVITPHAAFFCEEAYREMREKAAREALRVLSGQAPRNCVNERWLRVAR